MAPPVSRVLRTHNLRPLLDAGQDHIVAIPSCLTASPVYHILSGQTTRVSEETISEETVLEETVPEETVPEETVPDETVREENPPSTSTGRTGKRGRPPGSKNKAKFSKKSKL